MRRLVARVTVTLLGIALGPHAFGAEPGVETHTLENGLTVLMRPLPGATHTALLVLFDIGGDHDPEGQSGLGHLIEHLYVTCSAGRFPARTAEQLMQQYAKGWNAQTGDRYTLLAGVKPNAELDAELEQAAARMRALTITAEELKREKGRLIDEVGNMFEHMPHIAINNLARELVRPTPAGGRRAGVPAHVEALTLEQVRARWTRYYKPANATLVLAGGFEPAQAKAAIAKHFSPLPKGEPTPPALERHAPDASPSTTVEVTSRLPGAGDAVAIAVASPDPASADYAPFLVVVSRLLEQVLQKGGWAAFQKLPVPVWFSILDDPWLLCITHPLGTDEAPADGLKALHARLDDALKTALAPDDAARVRMHYGFLLGLQAHADAQLAQNPYGVAFGIGRRHQLGLDRKKLGDALDALSAEAFAKVAKRIFATEKRATVTLKVR